MAQDFTTVNAPDGKVINFPSSMSTDDIQGAMQKLYPVQETKVSAGSPITPKEGESFADTMKRAVQAGKTVTPEELAASAHSGYKKIPTVLGAALLAGPAIMGAGATLPAQASAAVGGGVTGGAVAGATGGGLMEMINKALHGAAGENVVTTKSAKDIATASGYGALTGGAFGLFEKVAGGVLTSKIARGAINESVGATARDVTYGNPAVAMLDNGITAPNTGDLEAYKGALRSGQPPEQALISAGGRVAQVQQKINEFAPQVDSILSKSKTALKVADVIDKPLQDAMNEIIGNRAMTEAEKDTAVNQIGALQKSLKEGLGPTVTPLEANQIKQAIGSRINWAGNVAVTDEVKPAYRAVYASLKNSVNKAVPEVADVNENLSNLLSAQTDLQKLMQSEEVGAGKGALGSAVTGIARRAEAMIGRIIPGAAAATQAAPQVTNAASGPIGATIADQLRAKAAKVPIAQPNTPGEPFHPGAGL